MFSAKSKGATTVLKLGGSERRRREPSRGAEGVGRGEGVSRDYIATAYIISGCVPLLAGGGAVPNTEIKYVPLPIRAFSGAV